MAPRGSTSLVRPKGVRRKRKKPKGHRSSRTSTTAGTSSALLKSDNLLRGVVPSAKPFVTIADFLFKGLSFTETPLKTKCDGVEAKVYGLGCAFMVPLSAIIKNAPQIPKAKRRASTGLNTNFTSGCLKQLRITVAPSGPSRNRKGHWALAFIPFSTVESRDYYFRNTSIPTLQDVLLVKGAAFGSGTESLSVNFRARDNSFCSLPHPLASPIGLVLLSYQDIARDSGSYFPVEDFGADILLSGVVKVMNPIPHVGASIIDSHVFDVLTSKLIRLNEFNVINGKCEETDKSVKIWGTLYPVKSTHLGGEDSSEQLDDGVTSHGGSSEPNVSAV